MITGPDPTPVQICDGQLAERNEFRTTHEEADVVIIQQAVHLATTGINSIRVVADDTDVFVLLLYYYTTQQLTCSLVMTGSSYGRTSDDIKATTEKHSDIIPYLLAAHVLSGCDTVAYLWGIGKVTVVKVLSSGKQLRKLGDLPLQLFDVSVPYYVSLGSTDMTLRYTGYLKCPIQS